jgi:thiosulfate dehydrogenase (quinone) large subunit
MSSLRTAIYVLGAVAAITLALLVIPAVGLSGDVRTFVTWTFWVSFVALLVALYVQARNAPGSEEVEIEGPGFARFLFNNRAAGLFWLPIRVFVGVSFLDAGWHKLSPTDANGVQHFFAGTGWLDGGSSLAGYWQHAVDIPEAPGRPAITYDWYRDFLNFLLNGHHEAWFAWLIVFGEIAVGLGLILGALTGIAAFFGALMNMSFLLAGSGSTNPILFTFAIGLILAWKVAGYYGLDRYLLPRLGTPWRPGAWIRRGQGPGEHPSSA